MCKRILSLVVGALLLGNMTASQAIIIEPTSPIMPDNNPSTSIEVMAANLQAQQQQLKLLLTQVNQQLASVQAYLTAQKALGLQWTNATNGQYPKNAIAITYGNNQSIHICHATFMQGIHPGIINNAGCLITYGGSSLVEQSYQVLTGNVKTHWAMVDTMDNYQHPEQDASNGTWQAKSVPIQGGYENGVPLYICQATYNNVSYVGKVITDNCNFAVGSQEIFVKDFQVLFGAQSHG